MKNTTTTTAIEAANDKLTSVKHPSVTILEMPLSDILKRVTFDTEGNATLTKGSKVTVEEIARVAIDFAEQSQSSSIKAANTLRLARMLPEVKVARVGKDGSAYGATVSAFEYACELVRTQCRTASQFSNLKGVIELLDIKDANNLPCSPFAVKEALGYLKTVGALNEETGKLTGSNPVVKALKAGTGVNAIRKPIAEAKAKRPDVFPAKGTPAKAAPAVTGGKVPDVIVTAPAETDTPDKLARELKSIRGRWEAMMAASKEPGATRKALVDECKQELNILARLAGCEMYKQEK